MNSHHVRQVAQSVRVVVLQQMCLMLNRLGPLVQRVFFLEVCRRCRRWHRQNDRRRISSRNDRTVGCRRLGLLLLLLRMSTTNGGCRLRLGLLLLLLRISTTNGGCRLRLVLLRLLLLRFISSNNSSQLGQRHCVALLAINVILRTLEPKTAAAGAAGGAAAADDNVAQLAAAASASSSFFFCD